MTPGVDFRPQSYIRQTARRQRARRMSIAAGLAALATAAGWVPLRAEVDRLDRSADQVSQQLAETRAKADQVESLRTQARSLQQRAQTQRQLALPLDASRLLATLTGIAPSSIKLEQLELITHAPKTAEADKKPGAKGQTAPAPRPHYTLRIDGVAPDDRTIIELVAALSKHPMFEDVRAPSNQFTGYDGLLARRFSIEATAPLDRPVHFDTPAQADAQTPSAQPGDTGFAQPGAQRATP
ncbi:MAG: hypothetical protein AAF288_07685 [Planctomycetota bacterium]